jgi:hypothetical protein
MRENEHIGIEQALAEQGYLLRPIEGNSMMPLLDEKTDLVKLVPAPTRLERYDLPLYRRPNGALVLHRVIKVRRRYYVICGDNRVRYERVPHEWVIARAVGRYRREEYLDLDTPEHRAAVARLCAKRDSVRERLRHWCGRIANRLRWRKE